MIITRNGMMSYVNGMMSTRNGMMSYVNCMMLTQKNTLTLHFVIYVITETDLVARNFRDYKGEICHEKV